MMWLQQRPQPVPQGALEVRQPLEAGPRLRQRGGAFDSNINQSLDAGCPVEEMSLEVKLLLWVKVNSQKGIWLGAFNSQHSQQLVGNQVLRRVPG